MFHRACQILTGIQRGQEVHRAAGRHGPVRLDFPLCVITDVAVSVSNIPGDGCCRGNTVHRAVHLCVHVAVFPLSACIKGDVRRGCVGKEKLNSRKSELSFKNR